MTWWLWTLLWLMLVAAALGVMFLIARSLWRKGIALARELGEASDRLSAVAGELQALRADDEAPPALAVFQSPAQLRLERISGRSSTRRSGD